jgi:hypothetical protein
LGRLSLRLVDAPKVIVLTTFHLDEYVFGASRAGASGFLLKDTPPADIVTVHIGARNRRSRRSVHSWLVITRPMAVTRVLPVRAPWHRWPSCRSGEAAADKY